MSPKVACGVKTRHCTAGVCLGLLVALAPLVWAQPANATEVSLPHGWIFMLTDSNLDGRGDSSWSGSFGPVALGSVFESRAFAIFTLADVDLAASEVVTSALLRIRVDNLAVSGPGLPGTPPPGLAARGFVGGGAEASNFQAGAILASHQTPSMAVGDVMSFDVTAFIAQSLAQHIVEVGLGIQALGPGAASLDQFNGFPRLDILTSAVPEPATYLYLLSGVAVLAWLMRRRPPAEASA